MVQIWWVNQSTRKGKADNEIVWAPETDKGGGTRWHWETLNRVQAGDLIYHYTDGFVVGTSVATNTAVRSGNPYMSGSSTWKEIGRRVPVDYLELEVPFARDEISRELRTQDAPKSGPFDRRGQVAQGYFFPVSPELWRELASLCGFSDVVTNVAASKLLDVNGPTDAVSTALRRREQRQVRELLLGGEASGTCGICGGETPAEYLVAGHIKQRSTATEPERRDLRNVMLVCVFGCDKAFELGDAKVGRSGLISTSDRLNRTRPDFAKSIDGTTAPSYSWASSRYFEHRLDSFNRAP